MDEQLRECPSEVETSKALYRTLIADRVGGGQRSNERHSAIVSLPSTFTAAGPQFSALGWTRNASGQGDFFANFPVP
jgi:hypothetical protein